MPRWTYFGWTSGSFFKLDQKASST